MTSGAGATVAYDSMNRVVAATEFSGGTEYYGYAPDNKRIMRLATNGTMEITLYGALGEKLQVYNAYLMDDTQNGVWAIVNPVRTSVWFAGKLVSENGLAVNQDRLGTNRAGGRYYPYGEGIGTGGVPTTAGSNTVAFATYTRDSWTGLDYADQRFYASSYGRFLTPDPSNSTPTSPSNPRAPQSWNRFSYVTGDPVNQMDPAGTDGCSGDGSCSDCVDNPFAPECSNSGSGDDPPSAPTVPTCNAPGAILDLAALLGPDSTAACVFGESNVAYQFQTPLSSFSQLLGGSSLLPQLAGAAAGAAGTWETVIIGGQAISWEVVVAGLAAPEVVITVAAVAGAIALYDLIQSRRLYTAVASCSVHQDGTPDHASVGRVTGTGQGVSRQAAVSSAFSAAQANVFAQFGVGFHAQHCSYQVSR
jgi:RHS repeat-associated protein